MHTVDAKNVELLSPLEAARYLRLSTSSLAHYRTRGDGPPFVRIGVGRVGRIAYQRDDLNEWLSARKLRSTSTHVQASETPLPGVPRPRFTKAKPAKRAPRGPSLRLSQKTS